MRITNKIFCEYKKIVKLDRREIVNSESRKMLTAQKKEIRHKLMAAITWLEYMRMPPYWKGEVFFVINLPPKNGATVASTANFSLQDQGDDASSKTSKDDDEGEAPATSKTFKNTLEAIRTEKKERRYF